MTDLPTLKQYKNTTESKKYYGLAQTGTHFEGHINRLKGRKNRYESSFKSPRRRAISNRRINEEMEDLNLTRRMIGNKILLRVGKVDGKRRLPNIDRNNQSKRTKKSENEYNKNFNNKFEREKSIEEGEMNEDFIEPEPRVLREMTEPEKERNKRIFGNMIGHIGKARKELKQTVKTETMRSRMDIEKRVSETISMEERERRELARRRAKRKTQRAQKHSAFNHKIQIWQLEYNEIHKNISKLTEQFQNRSKFLITQTKPMLYFSPTKFNDNSNELLKQSKTLHNDCLKEEINRLIREIPDKPVLSELELDSDEERENAIWEKQKKIAEKRKTNEESIEEPEIVQEPSKRHRRGSRSRSGRREGRGKGFREKKWPRGSLVGEMEEADLLKEDKMNNSENSIERVEISRKSPEIEDVERDLDERIDD